MSLKGIKTVNKKDYNNIKFINAYVGGYFGYSYSVKIDFIKQNISWECSERGLVLGKIQRRIREKTVNNFKEVLNQVNIFSWEEYYSEPIMDGTSWSVEIAIDDQILEKSGSNAFPEEWDSFCKSISKLVRKPFR